MLPLIFAGVAAVAGATGAYLWQENHYERVIAEQRAAQSALLAEAYANAKRETERMAQAKDEAERKARDRIAAARRDAAASASALSLLSSAADTALSHASTTHAACLADANSLTVVLGKCSGELQDMGEIADGWHNEAITLREAWPK